MIERKKYLEQLVKFKDKDLIKVVTGLRRVGKSTLLKMFTEYLVKNSIERKRIISINFENMKYDHLKNIHSLHGYIMENIENDGMNYVFLDEIQQVENFEKVVDSLYIHDNIDLYITGSNANLLSSELSTLLSGRYIEIEVFPLSFKEYMSQFEKNRDLSIRYKEYIEFSSFPYVSELNKDREMIWQYLDGVYNSVILKDVIARNSISNAMMLKNITEFLFDNIGNITSTKKISDTMTSNGRKISTPTVESYIHSLLESYIIYQAKRYDIKGKQYLKTLEKYYVADIGLRYYLLGYTKTDVGHILENIIYLELLRRGYEVYIGKVGKLEVDFIAKNQKGTVYIQVAATVRNEETLKRELKPLKALNDAYPKYILTLDDDPIADYEGIIRKNALEFLLED
jgi:hypothetical protein